MQKKYVPTLEFLNFWIFRFFNVWPTISIHCVDFKNIVLYLLYCTHSPLRSRKFIWKPSSSCHNTLDYTSVLCLVLLQVPKCFLPVQMFWAWPKSRFRLVLLPNFLCWHKRGVHAMWFWSVSLSGQFPIFFLSAKEKLSRLKGCPCGFVQSLGQPIVWPISHLFGQAKLFPVSEIGFFLFVHSLEVFVQFFFLICYPVIR